MGLFDFWKRKTTACLEPEPEPVLRKPLIARREDRVVKPKPPQTSEPTPPVPARRLPKQHNEPLIPSSERDRAGTPSAALAALARPCWLMGRALGEGPIGVSRTGGHPDMVDDEDWPDCGKCDRPLSFLFQLDRGALPDGAPRTGGGLLRLFYCLEDDCIGEGEWEPFSVKHALPVTTRTVARRQAPDGPVVHQPAHVVQWVKLVDYPNWEDREDLIQPADQDEDIAPREGHKLGGWPFWVQSPERPRCRICNTAMEPFFQLDMGWDFSFEFGDMGVGHISQCPSHPEVIAFSWACS